MKHNLRSWKSIPRAFILFCILLICSIDISSATINHELKEELRGIHQEIGSLRDENHQQNMEIALLKEMAGLLDNPNDQKIQKEQPNDQIINQLSTRTGNDRQKRPYRLLPPHKDDLDGEGKRKVATISPNRQFYGPPTGCSDLSLLGFTLNGFYQVKSNESKTNSIGINNDTKLETVFCAFKQPERTFNPALLEKRIISRRETKPSSGRVLYFHATRKIDLKFNGGFTPVGVTFDKVNLNLENAFDGTTGTFTLPKSGVYLFIFRGLVTFSQERVGREVAVYYFSNTGYLATHFIFNTSKSINTELDKLFKGNRGDTISLKVYFNEIGAKFSAGNSTSFAAFLLEE